MLLVVRPGAPSSFLLLVAMPFVPSVPDSWLEFLASQRSEQLSWRLQRAFDERVECLESESPLAVSYVEMMHRE